MPDHGRISVGHSSTQQRCSGKESCSCEWAVNSIGPRQAVTLTLTARSCLWYTEHSVSIGEIRKWVQKHAKEIERLCSVHVAHHGAGLFFSGIHDMERRAEGWDGQWIRSSHGRCSTVSMNSSVKGAHSSAIRTEVRRHESVQNNFNKLLKQLERVPDQQLRTGLKLYLHSIQGEHSAMVS